MAKNQDPSATTDTEFLWKHYEVTLDLYKHYQELLLKLVIFYYAITGGILSFYFSKVGAASNLGLIRYSLLLPLAMSVGCSLIYVFSVIALNIAQQDLLGTAEKLGLDAAPDFRVLTLGLITASALTVLTALGILVLFFNPNVIL